MFGRSGDRSSIEVVHAKRRYGDAAMFVVVGIAFIAAGVVVALRSLASVPLGLLLVAIGGFAVYTAVGSVRGAVVVSDRDDLIVVRGALRSRRIARHTIVGVRVVDQEDPDGVIMSRVVADLRDGSMLELPIGGSEGDDIELAVARLNEALQRPPDPKVAADPPDEPGSLPPRRRWQYFGDYEDNINDALIGFAVACVPFAAMSFAAGSWLPVLIPPVMATLRVGPMVARDIRDSIADHRARRGRLTSGRSDRDNT